MKERRNLRFAINIQAPAGMSNERIRKLVDGILNSGYSDAGMVSQSGEGDTKTANAVLALDISSPVLLL